MIKKIILSLIICFGLINISFGEWSAHPINGYINSTLDSSFEIGVLTYGNLSTYNGNESKNVFAPSNQLIFYRNQNQSPILLFPNFLTERWGGELKYYYTCDKIPDSNFNGMENCGNYSQLVNKIDLTNFFSNVSSSDRRAYNIINGLNDYYTFQICFSSNSLNKSLCFGVKSRAGNSWRNLYPIGHDINDIPFSGSYINAYSYNFDNIPNSVIGNSPGTRIIIPDYSIGSGRQLRNYEVLIGFEYMGLSKEYCYGGFDIDNIFLPSEQFSDFSGYSFGDGASIFDLYNAYSGGLSMKPFLSTYYQSFLNVQLSNFHNKSKALLMLFQQYQSANDREWGSFKLNDLMDYCDLYFNLKNNNRENDGDIYTGNNQNAINSYKLNTKIPEGGFTNTGVLASGSQFTGFSSAEDFFGRLTNLFQSNIDGVNDTFPPIIPSYIVAFMLAIILIRIISH